MLRSFAGGDLFGETWGSAPPRVLALHGWRRTHADFAGVFGRESDRGPADAIAVDLPGFGASPPPASVWGSGDYASKVATMLDAERATSKAGPVVVIGHSFGGRVAVHLAATRPDLVKALVLTASPLARTPGPRNKPPAAYRLVRAARKAGIVSEVTLERARQRYGSADYRAAQGVMRDVLVRTLAEDYTAQLAAISCPVSLVWGDDDTEVPLAVAERVQTLVSVSTLVVCPGAGHLTPLTVPGRIRDAVDVMLADSKSATSQ